MTGSSLGPSIFLGGERLGVVHAVRPETAEDAVSDEQRGTSDPNRRDFLKKSLAAGAVVWSAPVVTSLPGGRAWAQTYHQCACNADAFGLFVNIPLIGVNNYYGVDTCPVDVTLGNATQAKVRATAICGADFSTVNGGCSAEASLATLVVNLGPAATPTLRVSTGILLTTASAACNPCGTTGGFSAAFVTVSGSLIGSTIHVPVSTACNLTVGGIVTVNEQFCNGDSLNVNAVHINVPGVAEVIVAHSAAGATGCACTPCS
jgi:hypothetical protein